VSTLPALTLAAAGLGLGHAVLPDHWLPLAVLARARGYAPRRVVRLSLGAALAHVAVSLGLGAVVVLAGLGLRDSVARHTDLAVGGVLLLTGAVMAALELAGRGHGHPHGHIHAADEHAADEQHHDHDLDHDHAHGHRHPHQHAAGHHHHGPAAHGHPHPHPHSHPHLATDHHHAATAVLDRPGRQLADSPATAMTASPESHPGHETPATDHPHQPRRTPAGLLVAFGAAASPDLTILPVFLAAGALGPAPAIAALGAFAAATIATMVGLTTAAAHGARRLTAPWTDRGANLLVAATLLGIGALVAVGVL
jgi:hypothetical protein